MGEWWEPVREEQLKLTALKVGQVTTVIRNEQYIKDHYTLLFYNIHSSDLLLLTKTKTVKKKLVIEQNLK